MLLLLAFKIIMSSRGENLLLDTDLCTQSTFIVLQILNLENNKLKRLPDSIGHLRSLQTLNVKSNITGQIYCHTFYFILLFGGKIVRHPVNQIGHIRATGGKMGIGTA